MKTLDDVIEAMERCSIPHYFDCKGCPYEDDDAEVGCRSDDRDADALHYLKEYQWQMTNPDGDHLQLEKCRALLSDFYRNDPLSWEELRTMEGKPVWIEEIGRKYSTPHWAIHNGIMDGYDGDENLYLEPFEVLTKFTLGKTWQAYRKERG